VKLKCYRIYSWNCKDSSPRIQCRTCYSSPTISERAQRFVALAFVDLELTPWIVMLEKAKLITESDYESDESSDNEPRGLVRAESHSKAIKSLHTYVACLTDVRLIY
jgi:hypothetical protein